MSTWGLDTSFITFLLLDGSLINCEILDTGGQENFYAINKSYYRKGDCCNNYIFTETSCKDNYNVDEFFTELVELTNVECKTKEIDTASRKNKIVK